MDAALCAAGVVVITGHLLTVLLDFPHAVYAVPCPLCKAKAGQRCQSTGGGNARQVPAHDKRWQSLTGWDEAKLVVARDLVLAQGSKVWWHLPEGYYAETEGWASPVAEAAKVFDPKRIRLSEPQAEEMERAAANCGVLHVSTAHFHGDAQHRQTVNSLERKGILRQTGVASHGYDRRMELTAFGWRVYRQHPRIMRRIDDSVAAELEETARRLEEIAAREQQVAAVAAGVADVPGVVPPKVERMPAPTPLPLRKPLGPIRGADVVSLNAVRARKRLAVLRTPGDAS